MLAVRAQVISVTPHRVSLESIFLSAVEEGKAAEAGRADETQEGAA